MEQRAFALAPGSLGGGGAISEKSLSVMFDVVTCALAPFRLSDEPLLDEGCDGGSRSLWYSCLEPGRGNSVSAVLLVDGSPST